MQSQHYNIQINLVELKAQLVKKLGPDRYKQYIFCLNKFLSLRLSKVEFNKVCLRILGRDNVSLHNQLIRSILKHACCGKTPVPPSSSIEKDDIFNHRKHIIGNCVSADGYQQRVSHSSAVQASGSPEKDQNRSHDLGTRSALGPYGKTSFCPEIATAIQTSAFNIESENDLNPPVAVEPDHAVKKLETLNSLDGQELLVTEQGTTRNPLWSTCWDPLLQFRISRGQRALPLANHYRSQLDGVLSDSVMLRERLDEIAVANGLEGASLESANIINHCLDSFLKGLIKSCIQFSKYQSSMVQTNGFKSGHSYQFQDNKEPSYIQEQRSQPVVSFRELRLAMEMNPQKLGEAWPMLLEKTCLHSFEE